MNFRLLRADLTICFKLLKRRCLQNERFIKIIHLIGFRLSDSFDFQARRKTYHFYLLVLLNFSAQDASVNTGIDMSNANILISNYTSINTSNLLRPYEAIVYELN